MRTALAPANPIAPEVLPRIFVAQSPTVETLLALLMAAERHDDATQR
jgi:hypothetical protein